MRRRVFLLVAIALVAVLAILPALPGTARKTARPSAGVQAPERVLVVAFDNTHLDDLQGIPSLWQFLQGAAFSTNHHTILPTRSAPGFAAIASGQYSDRTGALDNAFFAGGAPQAGFAYWESLTGSGLSFGLEEPPWTAFNAAGRDVGAVGMSPIVLETNDDVRTFTTTTNPDAPEPAAYRGVAIYHADGTRELGAPNIPWLWREVGGFPGWPLRAVEYPLTVTALMQEHGVPITFTYLENLHAGRRPGEYDDVLARYDAAFRVFFDRLAANGITPENSLFVFTTDEGDHLAPDGGRAVGLRAWLEDNPVYPVPRGALQIAGGAAADVYLGPEVDPARAAATLRTVPEVQAVAWGAGLRAARMTVPADPSRTPAFTVFAQPDTQFRAQGGAATTRTAAPLWNHGTLGSDMETVWLALRGPGIRPGPLDAWTDHVDILPTVHFLLGMPDAGLDGRVIVEAFDPEALPPGAGDPAAGRLAAAFKQVSAPLGEFTHWALAVSTRAAFAADTPDGVRLDAALGALVDERDALAPRMRALLVDAAAGRAVPAGEAESLLARADSLLRQMQALAQE
jgi:arylsulfatase A-like enzyme